MCKNDMKSFNISVDSWEEHAEAHSIWREHLAQGGAQHEVALSKRMEAEQERRKQPAVILDSNLDNIWSCEICTELCRSQIGLVSHKRIRQTPDQTSYQFGRDSCQ